MYILKMQTNAGGKILFLCISLLLSFCQRTVRGVASCCVALGTLHTKVSA